jgi:NTE family protein
MAGSISLNLGGGAARGFAHVGAMRAIIEQDIRIDLLVGISMGSICGGIYSVMPDVDFLEKRLLQLINFDMFKSSVVGTWRGSAG